MTEQQNKLYDQWKDVNITKGDLIKLMPYWQPEGLVLQQARFIFFYVKTWDKLVAYRLAYKWPPEKKNDRLCNMQYNHILQKEKVQRVLARFGQETLRVDKQLLENELFDMYYQMATYNIADIIDSDGKLKCDLSDLPKGLQICIEGIVKKYSTEGVLQSQEVKLVNRTAMMKELARYIDMINNDAKVTHEIAPDVESKLKGLFNKAREEL